MVAIIERYGFKKNRAGFIVCPFHSDKNPSMKIYTDSFHCFGCGAHGDIFSFVQRMENCTFYEAFQKLGGTKSGGMMSDQIAYHTVRRKAARETHEAKKKRLMESYGNLCDSINATKEKLKTMSPEAEEFQGLILKSQMEEAKLEEISEQLMRLLGGD